MTRDKVNIKKRESADLRHRHVSSTSKLRWRNNDCATGRQSRVNEGNLITVQSRRKESPAQKAFRALPYGSDHDRMLQGRRGPTARGAG